MKLQYVPNLASWPAFLHEPGTTLDLVDQSRPIIRRSL